MQNDGKSAFGLDPNVAAGLAYVPVCLCHLIFSIVILATDKTNKLARFHAVQSLLISACMLGGYIVMFVLVSFMNPSYAHNTLTSARLQLAVPAGIVVEAW